MSEIVQVSDLATFMKQPNLDSGQAQLMLDMVESLACTIVQPLPAAAKTIICTAVARAIPNPSGTAQQSMGGSTATWGAGGLYLTKTERRELRRMAGIGGGAFTVNTAPKAGEGYRDPLRPLTSEDTEQLMYDYDIPGRPA